MTTDTHQMRKPPEPDKRGDFHETYKEIVPMDIEFKNPPASARGVGAVGKHQSIAAALVARPGEWALILPDVSASTPTLIKRAGIRAYEPAGSFEAVVRGVKDGRGDVYARYVGDPRAAA